MKIGIIYMSPNGTTRSVASRMADQFKKHKLDVMLLDLADILRQEQGADIVSELRNVSVLGFGSPVFHMRFLKPMEKFLSNLNEYELSAKKAFVFAAYAGITSGKALPGAAAQLREYGIPLCGATKNYVFYSFISLLYFLILAKVISSSGTSSKAKFQFLYASSKLSSSA
jgi:flavorubredoxin